MTRMLAALLAVSFSALARAQESAALFDAPLVTLGPWDRYAFLTDLDQDGFQDAVSWWWTTPEWDRVAVRGLRNDGTGRFVASWSAELVFAPYTQDVRTFACQLDADGQTDVCVVGASRGAAEIRALRLRGLMPPEPMTGYSITQTGFGSVTPEVHAVMTDFTGDGWADLAYSAQGTLRMMEYVPGSGLALRSITTPFGSASNVIEGLLEIDANGDATPDLLAWRNGTLQMIETQGCIPGTTYASSPGISDYNAATGDLDGDGDRDLVLWGPSAPFSPSTYVVGRRIGPAGPAGWSFEPAATGGPSEFLFDVDGDGDLDGVCCGGSGGSSTPTNSELSLMRVSVNDGTGAFAPAIERPWLGSDHLAGIADIDHDGDLDVVSGRCTLYGRGPLTEPPMAFDPAHTHSRTADMDGDSDPDFAVGLNTLERNLGDGRTDDFAPVFQAPPTGTQFQGPGWPGDFDGDGDVDLVVKHVAGPVLLGQRFLANLGGGAFADGGVAGPSGVEFNPGASHYPHSSLAADADGDGDLDLITRRYTTQGTTGTYGSRVWWNDGSGYFTAGPEFLEEFIQWIGDLSGDGIPDIVGTTKNCSRWCEQAGWHEGLGGGAFGAHVELSRAEHQWAPVAVADLDGDGDVDLAIAFDGRTKVYWNDGAGVFTEEAVPSVRSGSQVWSTDYDGDGRLDLLISSSSSLLIVRREEDNSGWREPVTQIIHENSFTTDAMLCDIDGDGDEDYVTDRVFRNARHALPESGRRRQVGAGTPGTDGLVPVLGAEGPFRVGERCEMRVRGGLGGAAGVLTITRVHGIERGPRGWIAPTFDQVIARIPFTLGGTPGVAGVGSWTQPYTVLPTFSGETRRYTVEISDPAAADGLARANALVISYGP